MKAREAAKAAATEKETQASLMIKELLILDLSKKCGETNNCVEEFSLYVVIKEMKEKIKNILRNESRTGAAWRARSPTPRAARSARSAPLSAAATLATTTTTTTTPRLGLRRELREG